MNQRIYGDDLTNNEHPFTKGMKELVKNLNAVDDIANKKQKSNVVTVVQSISQLKQEWWQMQKTPFFVVFLICYKLRIIIVMRNYNWLFATSLV